ncbi:hypothetical protein FB451DRAFT_1186538 [Mycena latifolia]|nr:hypothetical protein FB451DRAFT_1186538 [Mycena latifolia]
MSTGIGFNDLFVQDILELLLWGTAHVESKTPRVLPSNTSARLVNPKRKVHDGGLATLWKTTITDAFYVLIDLSRRSARIQKDLWLQLFSECLPHPNGFDLLECLMSVETKAVIVRASSGPQIMKIAFKLVSTALFLARLTGRASAADCSNQQVNGGATGCAQRVADRMCSQLACGGTFDQKVGDIVHVQAVLSGGACPTNCAAAVSDILSQCIENDWSDGTWDLGGEWYWIYSVTNTDAGSAGC